MIKQMWNAIAKKWPKHRMRSSMWFVHAYGVGLVLITALMIAAWVVKWVADGSPDIPQLVNIFKEYTGPAVVAAVGFIVVFNIDVDRDGRPDAAERKAKEDSPPGPPISIRK